MNSDLHGGLGNAHYAMQGMAPPMQDMGPPMMNPAVTPVLRDRMAVDANVLQPMQRGFDPNQTGIGPYGAGSGPYNPSSPSLGPWFYLSPFNSGTD